MNVFQGALLGLIQGLGEFLPISSSGHLLLAQKLMNIDANDHAMKLLDILLHVGTLIPLLLVFWREWIDMIRHPVRNKTLLLLIVASLPTLLIYLAAKKLIVIGGNEGFAIFDSGWFLGVSFLLTAVFLLICDRISIIRKHPGREPGILSALIMGAFQGFGLLPGVSRSGSTILGGVSTGLSKEKAARLSFMMSAPAIAGSLIMEGKDAFRDGYFRDVDPFVPIVGVVVAAATGFFALRFMLKIINRISLGWFALYVAVIGIFWLVLQLSGSSLVPPLSVPAAAPVEASPVSDIVDDAFGVIRTVLG